MTSEKSTPSIGDPRPAQATWVTSAEVDPDTVPMIEQRYIAPFRPTGVRVYWTRVGDGPWEISSLEANDASNGGQRAGFVGPGHRGDLIGDQQGRKLEDAPSWLRDWAGTNRPDGVRATDPTDGGDLAALREWLNGLDIEGQHTPSRAVLADIDTALAQRDRGLWVARQVPDLVYERDLAKNALRHLAAPAASPRPASEGTDRCGSCEHAKRHHDEINDGGPCGFGPSDSSIPGGICPCARYAAPDAEDATRSAPTADRCAHDARNLRIIRDGLPPGDLTARVALGSAIATLEQVAASQADGEQR